MSISAAQAWIFDVVRDRVMGSANAIFGETLWASDAELRDRVGRAADHFARELLTLSQRRSAGSRVIRRQVYHLLGSYDARLCALIQAWPAKRGPISVAEALQMAGEIDCRKQSPEPVFTFLKAKPEGGFRRLWDFGPRTRAMQTLAVQILMALWGPAKFEFARKGRGRDKALATVIASIEKEGGARWFLTADIKDCFSSINREALKKIIPLPTSVIESSLFVTEAAEITHDEDEPLDTSEIAVLLGMPQGSLASPYIVSKLIEPVLEKLQGEVVLGYCDDLIAGSRTQVQAQSNMLLLDELMKAHPAGPLLMKADVAKLGTPIDFLSYRIKRRWLQYGGGARVVPSPKAFKRLALRARQKLEPLPYGAREAKAEGYFENWLASNKLWDQSETGKFLAWSVMYHVLKAITLKEWQLKNHLQGTE